MRLDEGGNALCPFLSPFRPFVHSLSLSITNDGERAGGAERSPESSYILFCIPRSGRRTKNLVGDCTRVLEWKVVQEKAGAGGLACDDGTAEVCCIAWYIDCLLLTSVT